MTHTKRGSKKKIEEQKSRKREDMIEQRKERKLWKIGIRTRLEMKEVQCHSMFPSSRLSQTSNKPNRGAQAEMVQCKEITVI